MTKCHAVTLNGKVIYIPSTFRGGDGLAIFDKREIAGLYCKYAKEMFELDYKVEEVECIRR